jgi:putative transposase
MEAAKAFFRLAKAVTGLIPTRVTTDGHPRAIRTELNNGVKHRTNQYLNNRIEQDHRGVKGRYGPMRGFKSSQSAARFVEASMNCEITCKSVHDVLETFHPTPAATVF